MALGLPANLHAPHCLRVQLCVQLSVWHRGPLAGREHMLLPRGMVTTPRLMRAPTPDPRDGGALTPPRGGRRATAGAALLLCHQQKETALVAAPPNDEM